MKLLLPTIVAPLALSAFATASNSFGGSSLYFLQGLSDADQDSYINTLSSYGAKVLRLWVTGTSAGCTKGSKVATSLPDFETTIGTYNNDTLKALDSVLAKMAAKGMKAIISPHDGNKIHDASTAGNGCDIYCSTYHTSFYSNTKAQAQYDERVKQILNYQSPSSGKTWGSWSEAIMAFDIQNEPFQFTSDGANNDPSGWLCGRAANFKKYITSPNIKVATGGIGGDQSHNHNLISAALKCSSIDIMSIHGYIGDASTCTSLAPGWISTSASNNKLAHVEEWGVATSYKSNFDAQVSALNAQDIPWVCRIISKLSKAVTFGPDGTETCTTGCCTGYDGFEVGLNSGKGNVKSALSGAAGRTTKQDWSFAGF
ncbi:putative mannan endo-1,4-beta-mannosidase F [Lachnellula suecica]|uniref:mannan endo-1,4-beta-mannosidase n=1 Tax=Lachnellula suecica TaxID=602035 RepID=A0A8T9BYZ3_9HELO|nr:putative mannan endo-1,4-beta-mannosidase F [Lachnellula suecica]